MTQDRLENLEHYVAGKLPGMEDVRVSNLSRIAGGASRETYRFVLSYRDAGTEKSRRLILRRDPVSSLLETERRTEFMAYKAFYGSAVPVPEMLWLEEDPIHLGRVFFIAEEIAGFEANPLRLQAPPYVAHHAEIGRRKWSILGEIAKQDPVAIGYAALFAPVDAAAVWQTQLEHWAGVLRADAIRAEPVMAAATRWLRRHQPPPPQKLSVVHGDYRSGNFLYDDQGEIHGILDWEMTHLGDPLEDLAWSLNRAWCYGGDTRCGGLLMKDDAVRIWQAASGLDVDPAALHWWELFSCVKAQALWVSAGRNWLETAKRELINVAAAWLLINRQDRAALELMGKI